MLRQVVFVIDCIVGALAALCFCLNYGSQHPDAPTIGLISTLVLLFAALNGGALLSVGTGPSYLKLYLKRKTLEEELKVRDMEERKKGPQQRSQYGTRA